MSDGPYPIRTERGIPLLRANWEEIKRHRLVWDQGVYISIEQEGEALNCGTAACLAGHAVLSVGARLLDEDLNAGQLMFHKVFDPETERTRWVNEWAGDLYGLSEHQTFVLFSGNRKADEIERMITALEANPEAELEYLKN